MPRFNQALNVIFAAVVLASVSVMTLGAAGVQQASAAPSVQAASHAVHVVQPANERWD